jgi:glutamate synthase (NADPH/NADH)
MKINTSSKQIFASWFEDHIFEVPTSVPILLLAFGFTMEQLNLLMLPMVSDGKEALGSMGNDAPLAAMATQPRLIYDYFCQLSAQVTNTPIDPIRESIVMSLVAYVGPEGNLLEVKPEQCHQILFPSSLISIEEMNAMKFLKTLPSRTTGWKSLHMRINNAIMSRCPRYNLKILSIKNYIYLGEILAQATQLNTKTFEKDSFMPCGAVAHTCKFLNITTNT